jgi:hypothetical protein
MSSIHPQALRARLAAAGRLARQQSLIDAMREDAPEQLPYQGHRAEQVRGYPNDLLHGLRETMKLLNQIDSGLARIIILGDQIVREPTDNPLFQQRQILRTYQAVPEERGEIIQLVIGERGQPKGLWQTHKKGTSITRLELLRRSNNEMLCKRVLERDRTSLERLGPSMGLPADVCGWLSYMPRNQSVWQIQASSIILPG